MIRNTCVDNAVESVERDRPQTIAAVQSTIEGWERIPMKIDSGAIDTVMPPGAAQKFAVSSTEQSRHGSGFRAANGTAIKHYGQRRIEGWNDDFQPLTMIAQVANVKASLGLVYQMLKAGNSVHFEPGNCYIQHVRTGAKTVIEEKNGTFEVGVWVKNAKSPVRASSSVITIGNRFQALQED